MKRFTCLLCALLLFAFPAVAEETALSGLFDQPSNVYSPSLAELAIESGAMYTAESAAIYCSQMGLDILAQERYDKEESDTSDTCAYTVAGTVATVRGEARPLVFVFIRGTFGGEWYSNFNVAPESMGIGTQTAENFLNAAKDVYETLKPLLEERENEIVYICGYSRGAACANLLGTLVSDEYGEENVYVYTAATPATLLAGKTEYGNIFNLVNADDLIPKLPLEAWGFKRAGVDVQLSAGEGSGSQWDGLLADLTTLCPSLESYYQDRHSLAGKGLAEDGETTWDFIQMLMESAGQSAEIEGADESSAQAFMQLLENTDFGVLLPHMDLFSQDMSSGWISQHMPTAYMALLQAAN